MTQTFIPADMIIYKTKDRTRVCEPTLIAFDAKTYKILAVGTEAASLNCDGESKMCISPFHFGIIDDFTVASKLIKELLKREFPGFLIKPTLAVCIPSYTDTIAQKTYEDLFLFAGAKKVDFYTETLEELLNTKSEKELLQYTAVLAITKENPSEYAYELMQETYERMQQWSLSKEQMIEMIKEL